MNDNVKQYSNRTEKHLNLLIKLLLQEQKQSDDDLHYLLIMVYPCTQITILFQIIRHFLLFFVIYIYHNVVIQLLNSFGQLAKKIHL